ncbi:hypothetical protein BH10BAC2_BH10BAC2_35720 [soil metagenome]
MRKPGLILVICFFANHLLSQELNTNTLYSPVTTKQAREERYKYLLDTTIRQYLKEPLNEDNEGLWNDALWSLELLQYKDAFTKTKMTEAWNKAGKLSEYFQKNLLETTYSLYKTEFKNPVQLLLKSTASIPVFLRCAEYLLRADAATYKPVIASLIKIKFANNTSVGLDILKSRMSNWNKPIVLPSLNYIFRKDFLKGQTVIYSLHRRSRDYSGIVIIRKPNGDFARNKDGSYFRTSQLARGITAYPFYITNGNTPQGIFKWTGFDHSKLLYIGPTTNLQMVMPYEAKPSLFFADSALENVKWNKGMYASLLPDSWKNYEGIYESFYAGAIGRYDIIMHGTTIDPLFYKGKTYYPQTPSLGCLCSYEEWDSSGKRVSSNQQQIADALESTGSSNGYVVVIDIDDKKSGILVDDILKNLWIVENEAIDKKPQ